MKTAQEATDRVALEVIIKQHVEHVSEIDYIDHGHDNLVAIVNRSLVFRFPRNDKAARRLNFEIALLRRIEGKINVLPIPKIVAIASNPLYATMRYLPGKHLAKADIMALSPEEQSQIGEQLAEYTYQFSSVISGGELNQLRKEAGLIGMEETWREYFARLFEEQSLPDNRLQPIVSQYYAVWKKQVESEQPNLAIHDDLHLANILFDANQVSAILDFGDANVGSAEEEMRGLYTMGERVLRATIRRYQELTGRSVDYEHVRIWAVTTNLARFVRYQGEQRVDHPAFLRAQANLREWLTEFPL